MFNKNLLFVAAGIIALLSVKITIKAGEENTSGKNDVIKAIQSCVEAKRGVDYEKARENALRFGNELLAILSEDKKDISTTEKVVRNALKSWIENPNIGNDCYAILSEDEESGTHAHNKPTDWTAHKILEKFGIKAYPFIYEILLKRETHPRILSAMIDTVSCVKGAMIHEDAIPRLKNYSIPVFMELLQIKKNQGEDTEYYTIQGWSISGMWKIWDISEEDIWLITSSAIWSLGFTAEVLNDIRPIESLKKIYIDCENMEPYKNTKKMGGIPNTVEARRNVFKEGIIEAIERIGQEEGEKVLAELEKSEKQDEMRQ
ncbi:MAG: hypothetical protein AB1798_23955, partial [Spirochaetota bacterium]